MLIFLALKECKIETGVAINGGSNVEERFHVEGGHEECASRCALTIDCVGWTFQISNSYCWLKSDDSFKVKASSNWITGTKSCGIKSKYS